MFGLSISKLFFTIILILSVVIILKSKKKIKKNIFYRKKHKVFDSQLCKKCSIYISQETNLNCNLSNCPWS